MFDWILDMVIDEIRQHPVASALAVWAVIRLFGTTVQTGWAGVLFVFGRARKELGPGFHPLLPVVCRVRQTPIRSSTLDLKRQRVTTADGLVYDVDASVVYRIVDAIQALTQVDDLRKGCEAILPLAMQDVLCKQTRHTLQERQSLDEEFTLRAQDKLKAWGVHIEQAGFTSIAPTHKTLRLTQLPLRTTERQRVLNDYVAQGMSPASALALLGTTRHLTGHAQARYRRLHRRKGPQRPLVVLAVDNIFRFVQNLRHLELPVGATVRLRLTERRRLARVLWQRIAPLRLQLVRDDPTAIDITATQEGSTLLVLESDRHEIETVQISIDSW